MFASRCHGLLLLSSLACGRPSVAPPAPEVVAPGTELRFDLAAIDRRVDPCRDFYDFACGGWRASHPIPADRTRWDRYAELAAENLARERAIVEAAARAPGSPSEQRIGAYFAGCMDERAIDARGLAPIREVLARIDALRTPADATELLAELHAHGVDALFAASPDTDLHDARRVVMALGRGALGLPSPGDYTSTDPASATLRGRYRAHLARLFQLLGATPDEAGRQADRTLAFELSLAQHALSAVEARRQDAQDHPMTLDELIAGFPAIAWRRYFTALGVAPLERVARLNVAEPAWLRAVNAALAGGDLRALRDQLRMALVHASASVLPGAIEREILDFDQRVVRGARSLAPRWRRCLALVDRDIGDDVGRIFVARYFSGDAKARMAVMADALLGAFRADIAASDWLGPPARAAAQAKLGKMLLVIGASNRPRSFDDLRVDRGDPFGNAWRARALAVHQRLAELAAPTDRETFFDSLPQALDGFGSKQLNATGFTAGFLQPPVFDPRMDDAVNFGGLGSVIGHELTHQFDDEGRKIDDDGNLRSWWEPDDVARFEHRAQCFIDEYSRFTTDDGTALDGRLTLGENIADNGGIRLSYQALQPSETGPLRDGFTPAQRFFLAWGQIRCENATPEAARRQARTDPHAAGRWRVDGVVSNLPEFARAFSCPAGAPMAPAERCRVW